VAHRRALLSKMLDWTLLPVMIPLAGIVFPISRQLRGLGFAPSSRYWLMGLAAIPLLLACLAGAAFFTRLFRRKGVAYPIFPGTVVGLLCLPVAFYIGSLVVALFVGP
jgi:hypothetical protein